MTSPRRKPAARYLAFIVEPEPGFEPDNWRQTPKHYRIIECIQPMQFKGSADAWKFLQNHEALKLGRTNRWAIYLDMNQSMLKSNVGQSRDSFDKVTTVKTHPQQRESTVAFC